VDSGQTWNDPFVVMNQAGGGSEGAPNMAVDSAGNVHMVFSDNGCVWHAARTNGVWSAPECVSNGVVANASIESPAMALGLGNQIHVLFWTDRRQLWYTRQTLPVAGETPMPTPTAVVATATALATATTPAATQTPLPDYGPPAQQDQATAPGYWALAAGVAPVVLLTLIVAVVRRPRRR
jgi:hypothetical protein